MSLVLKDRVLETATSPGTGTVALLGASTGYQSFANAIGNANTTYYTIATVGGSGWEVGIGTYYSGNNSVVRNTVLASSNAGNLVNFSSGTQSVFVTYPAEESVYLNNGNVSTLGNITSATWNANTISVAYGGTGLSTINDHYIPFGNNSTSLQTTSRLQFVADVLQVGPGYQLGGTTNPLTASVGSANNYIQSYVFNNAANGSSSADFVAYGDNSSDAHGWADIGFTSSTYNDATYSVTGPNEAYVLGSAPSGASASGNLVYATDSTGTTNAHQWYVGGFGQAKNAWKMQLTSTGLQLASALGTAYGGTGLTSFTSGGAMYATSNSSLTTGTLPVTAGGTGITTLTAGYIPYGNGSNALASTSNLTYANNTVSAPYFNATGSVTANVAYGAFNNGSLGYSDTGIFGSFVTTQNSYGQFIIQNKSSGSAASADYIVTNDLGTATSNYGDFGINGSTYSGSNNFTLPRGVYLAANGGNLALGTVTNNGIHFITNNSSVDAMTINSSNAIAFSGSYGANTYLLQSTGNATAPIWQSPANISAGSVVSTLTFTSAGNGSASGVSFNGSANQVISSNTILPSQAGNSGKVLTTDGANTLSWTTVSSGAVGSYTRTSFTATAGQTTFSATYTVGYVEVYLNGVFLNGSDYTATNGTTVVLAVAASAGDIVETVAYNTTSIAVAGGANTQIQYNSSGSLAGNANLTFNGFTLSSANINATSVTVGTANISNATFTNIVLGTPISGTLTNLTGLPISTGVSGLGTGVAAALANNIGSANAVVVNGGALGTPSSGNLTNTTVDGTNKVGYLILPQNSQATNYTLALTDAGKHIYHALGSAAATYTIDSNANVAFTTGTAVTFVNMSANNVTISITSDTMYLAGTGTTGNRTLAQYGTATALKLTSTSWVISGTGLT